MAMQEKPQGINGWADTARFDGETEEKALRRRVRMHEFLMTGGIQLTSKPTVTYSEPIDPLTVAEEYPDCPWHGVDPDGTKCSAWEEIVAGRGTGEVVSPTLPELRGKTYDELADERAKLRVARDQAEGFFIPQIDAPGANPRKEASSKFKPGAHNGASTLAQFSGSQHRADERRTYIEPEPDARDVAIDALQAEAVPDEIVFEDGEDEGDEEEK
jgi:hypothetical protein